MSQSILENTTTEYIQIFTPNHRINNFHKSDMHVYAYKDLFVLNCLEISYE